MYQFALQDSNTAVSVKRSIKQKSYCSLNNVKGNMIPLNDKTMRVREYQSKGISDMKWHLNVERGIPFLEVGIVILPGAFNNRLGY